MIFDPIDNDDIFACVILLVDDLSYADTVVGNEDGDAFFLIVLDGIFRFSRLLTGDCYVDH